ncbi:helix-turn-helix domain-containing protein [Plantactinospora sp. CA-290183]|uniref:helix-turn-helix domain-containing protein n=1 Tax=Plantactinospora sp. CA-290183 TaxID=3240006 RepID=UPI003D8B021E
MPFAVPDAVWKAPDMLEALAGRDIAQVFRLVQRATRASQTHLGLATGLSQAQVSEIISGGRRVASIDVLARIAAGLAMPNRARMTLFLGEREPPPPAPPGGGTTPVPSQFGTALPNTATSPPSTPADPSSPPSYLPTRSSIRPGTSAPPACHST